MPLKETLSKLLEQEKGAKQTERDGVNVLEEWKRAVPALFAELRGHLQEYEREGSLTFSDTTIGLIEDGLGHYDVPVLKISAGRSTISVQPVGRVIGDTFGRIDMLREGLVVEPRRIVLVRRPSSPKDSTLIWRIRMPIDRGGLLGRLRPRTKSVPLNNANLEQAVELLLDLHSFS